MIPVSLLLILVAVTLLVLGLTGGSSNLLISSIVASLLAAVALVIGARQTAAKRAAVEPAPEFPPAPEQTYAAEPEFAEATGATRDTVQFEPVPAAAEGDLSGDEASVAAAADSRRSDAEPDYDRAADTINAARSENPGADAWRRAAGSDEVSEPRWADEAPDPRWSAASEEEPEPRWAPAADDAAAEPAEEEFAEPDADDPDDEPLPQAVRPADAVRVARMDAEVLVVDGRPRYHLADCPHLVGKLTEPIPVNEAIELGFTPCGLCRPVDRLAATAAHS